jgi:murein DD-endopeptidase MepM/ murein hydrolase activator NlpD
MAGIGCNVVLAVGRKTAKKGKTGMADALVERAWAWLHATFPERQIYIRSEGRVQFFTFGPTLQATFAGLSLIFLGWVAFTSVNVIFKDHIIAAKDRRYQQMQSTYENRVADLQLSYDELNNALVSAEDRFKASADELQTKQFTIAKLLDRKGAVDSTLARINSDTGAADGGNSGRDTKPTAMPPISGMMNNMPGGENDTGASSVPQPALNAAPGAGGTSQLGIMPETVEPQPRTARPTRASFLDDAVSHFAEALFHPKPKMVGAPHSNAPALRVLAQQTVRVERMSAEDTALLVGVDQQIAGRVGDLQSVLRRVGVDTDTLERQSSGGVGGPYIPIQDVRIDGISDAAFTTAYEGAVARTEQLDSLLDALHHVPLTTPVHGSQFQLTSGFGARVDPFSERFAFHSGVDFGGPWGSIVSATAPGVVVFAGPRNGYGNMVELDHGYGFHTRYAHLSSILVRIGARVEKGSPVGKLGSTGRSTGPHVHYEVWLADKVRDPSKFIEAGRHVLQ